MTTKANHEACKCIQCKRSVQIHQDRLSVYRDSLFYDCTIRVGTANPMFIKCHKMILASASEPFAKMLHCDFSEGNKGKDEPITLDDGISPEALEYAIKFIYGEVEDSLDMSIACEVYTFAHTWLIKDLMQAAADMLKSAKWDDILLVYETVKVFGKEDHLQSALKTIVENTNNVFDSRHWLEAEESTVLDIFQQPVLKVESEKDLFDALVWWGKENAESAADLRNIVSEPLKLIRFLTMSATDFALLCTKKAEVFSVEDKFQIIHSITLNDPKKMPANFTRCNENRKKKTYFSFSNFGEAAKISLDERLNSVSPRFSLTFYVIGDFPIYLSHVVLDCLILESNRGRRVDLTCTLTQVEGSKQAGFVKLSGKIGNDADELIKFTKPVHLEPKKWYVLSVKYFNQDLLCTAKYEYKSWSRYCTWKTVHESFKLHVCRPPSSHYDVKSLEFCYQPKI